jgi:hypothetical protein
MVYISVTPKTILVDVFPISDQLLILAFLGSNGNDRKIVSWLG